MPDSVDSHFDSVAHVLQRLKGGSEDAATELYQRYKNRLTLYVRQKQAIGKHLRPDVQSTEVAHDAIAKLLHAISREKFNYQSEKKLFAWLITVMLHSIADRAARIDVCRLPVELEEVADHLPSPAQLTELADATQSALTGLDDLAVQVFDLWSEGYSQRQIAEQLGCNRRRVQRILELIACKLHHRLLDDTHGREAT